MIIYSLALDFKVSASFLEKETLFFVAIFITFGVMDKLLIYVPKLTSRIRYTFKLVFSDILLMEYELTDDLDFYLSSDRPRMQYAPKPYSDDLFFMSHGLLLKRGTEVIDVDVVEYEGINAIFPVEDSSSAMPFDVFSAIFYLVSRYEEYLPFVRDKHGRFTAEKSLAFQLGFLRKPVVNIWALKIRSILLDKYPDLKYSIRNYKFIPTYDIDSAWAYKEKGLVRTIGGYLLALKNMDWYDIKERTLVLLNMKKDPFDTYDLQLSYQKKYGLKPVYFFLFARYSNYDKNINTRNKRFRHLIIRIMDYAKIGIHPSYYSVEHPELVKKELEELEKVVNKDINRSRQHFLRLILPHTYRNIIENDIIDDYTMGYASQPGFRAGICTPFYFYDLDIERETNLRLNPFAVMDGTLNDYMHLTTLDALDIIKELIDEVKKVNGTFISLWHNESLSDELRWKGWRKLYEQMLELAVEN